MHVEMWNFQKKEREIMRFKLVLGLLFVCFSLSAKQFDFDKLKDKTNIPIKKVNHVVYYTASWCLGCREFCPKLHKFIDDNEDMDFDVIVVSLDYKKDAFDKLMKKEKIKLYIKYGKAKDTGIYEYCGILIPWITFFDKEGNQIFSEQATEKLLDKIKNELKKKKQ